MAKSDLAARPVFHLLRDSIDAHVTVVFAALAISRKAQARTGLSINKIVKLLRPLRTATSSRSMADQRSAAHPGRSARLLCSLRRALPGSCAASCARGEVGTGVTTPDQTRGVVHQ
jgi:hypothetical protein